MGMGGRGVSRGLGARLGARPESDLPVLQEQEYLIPSDEESPGVRMHPDREDMLYDEDFDDPIANKVKLKRMDGKLQH